MRQKSARIKPFSLHTVLTVPYVMTLIVTVGLVGFLSFRNGQQAINAVTTQLRSEITARIEQHLEGGFQGRDVDEDERCDSDRHRGD